MTLLLLLQGCSTALPPPVVVRPPPLPPLPIQARQPAPPTLCVISCSLGLSTLLDSLLLTPTPLTSPAKPVSATTTP
jgi:hypothetical protein